MDRFIATSSYYADRMAEYMQVPRERIDVVLPGITGEGLAPGPGAADDRPPAIAYMARICPEKGLDRLIDALIGLRKRPGLEETRLLAGGFLARRGPEKAWFKKVQAQAADALKPEAFVYVGEVDRAGKRQLLLDADVLCVPATRPEPKGMFVLEGWACGLPFVGFDHGAFGELFDAAGTGEQRPGVLTPPNNTAALADALADLLTDPSRREAMGRVGCRAIATTLSADRMAADVFDTIRKAVGDR